MLQKVTDASGKVVARSRGGGQTVLLQANIGVSSVTIDLLREQKAVAVLRSGRLGDVLMLQPAMRALRSSLPSDIPITLVTDSKFHSISSGYGYDVSSKVPSGAFVVDLESYPERHPARRYTTRTDLFGLGLGLKLTDRRIHNRMSWDTYTSMASRVSALYDGDWKPVIVIAPRSIEKERTWDGMLDVAKRLGEQYLVICVDPIAMDVPEGVVNWTGKTSIDELQALVMMSRLVITPDSGTLHLAASCFTQFIGVFTQGDKDAKDPDVRCRYYKNYAVVTPDKDGRIDPYKVYILARNIMEEERIGRNLVSSETGTVHRGNRTFHFVKGLPLWVPEDDAVDLLNNPAFKEDGVAGHKQRAAQIVWIVSDMGLGGAEIHTLELLKSFNSHKWEHHIICTNDSRDAVLQSEYTPYIQSQRFVDEGRPDAIRQAVMARNPDLIVLICNKTRDQEIRKLFPAIPVVCIVHAELKLDFQEDTIFVFPSESAMASSGVGGLDCSMLIKNGVDVLWWAQGGESVKRKLGLSPNDFVVFYGGRLGMGKNIGQLLAACERTGAKAILAGEGEERQILEEQVREWGIEEDILFRGYVPRRAVRNLMLSSDCLVLPSKSESMPLVVLEAMSLGLPVISTRVGDVPKLLRDGDLGYLYNVDSTDELVEQIEEVMVDPKTAKVKAEAAQMLMLQEHTLHSMCRQYWNLLGSIMLEPLVSVIVLVRGDVPIGPTVQSVLDNDYENIEVIITGDGDVKEAERWVERDTRVSSIINQSLVPDATFLNWGIDAAIGTYITFIEAGQSMGHNRISSSVEIGMPLQVCGWCDNDAGRDAQFAAFTDDGILHLGDPMFGVYPEPPIGSVFVARDFFTELVFNPDYQYNYPAVMWASLQVLDDWYSDRVVRLYNCEELAKTPSVYAILEKEAVFFDEYPEFIEAARNRRK